MIKAMMLIMAAVSFVPAAANAATTTACTEFRVDGTGSDQSSDQFVCKNAETMAIVYCNEQGGTVVAGSWTVDDKGFVKGDDEVADRYYCEGHLTCRKCTGASATPASGGGN